MPGLDRGGRTGRTARLDVQLTPVGLLIDGEWRPEAALTETSSSGEFRRPTSAFRQWIGVGAGAGYPAVPNRYHLYVSRACPWCHRTLIARVCKRLEGLVSVSFVEPTMLAEGWSFASADPLTGARYVHELYTQADPLYSGRATLPVLWDKETNTIVNNESADIIRMFNREFDDITQELTDYYPEALAAEIDEINTHVYETVNNGVYRAGFAATQSAYTNAVHHLFDSLDWLEVRLHNRRYLLGDLLTECDWRLFPTLVRFDTVYYGHFRCNLRHVYEYPALWGYTREIYQMPGIAATVALDEYKLHYYGSHRTLNPSGIIPAGPLLDLNAAHERGALSAG